MNRANGNSIGNQARVALESAARTSLYAPSVFNTQPWNWRIYGDVMELWADRTRQLEASDPDGNLLMLSCGAILHHARVALGAAGRAARVERLPDPERPDLLARVRLGAAIPVSPQTLSLADAIVHRRTDRRAFGARQVPAVILERLRLLAEQEGAGLHVVRPDQMAMLAVSADLATTAELDDPDYQVELRYWTSRPESSGDGVPLAAAVQPGLRRVPVRDFAPDVVGGMPAGEGRDEGASYVVLFGVGYRPIDLLRGGEALSALLLTATAEGLATAPLSDAVEVTWPHHLLRYLVSDLGEPYVVVRLGYVDSADPLPPVPRRAAVDVIAVHDQEQK